MFIVKSGSHRSTVTLLGTHVACGGVRFATCHATGYSAVHNGTERLSKWRTVRKICSRINVFFLLQILMFQPVATDFAVGCSTCAQSVEKYVNVESSGERFCK